MRRLTVSLLEYERDALFELAQVERRTIQQQASQLIREALIHRGLLPETGVPQTAKRGSDDAD